MIFILLSLFLLIPVTCGSDEKEKIVEESGLADISGYVGKYYLEPSRNDDFVEIRSDGTAIVFNGETALETRGEVRLDRRMLRIYLDGNHGEPDGSFLLTDNQGKEGWRGRWQGDIRFLIPAGKDNIE